MMRTFAAAPADAGKRLDRFLAEQCERAGESVSRSYLAGLIERGAAAVDGAAAGKSYRLRGDEQVTLSFEPPRELEAAPQSIPLDIVYEDDQLLVVNKARGMVVHPAPGSPDGTLVNALLWHCGSSLSGINGVLRPGIVHRIDKDTSGLLVVAKTNAAHTELARQIAEHSVTRRYFAVAHGHIAGPVTIERPIGRSPHDRVKYCVTEKNAKYACTFVTPTRWFNGFTQIACQLKTGRTHQIRVHLASVGHPIAGDPLYGPPDTPALGGQCLHAGVLGFVHPATGQYMEFSAPLPGYFSDFTDQLRERYE